MANYFEGGEFPLILQDLGLRKGRSIRDGYARGWGLQFGGLRQSILDDPIYQEALALAQDRTIQAEDCRMNLFLLAKYFLPRMLEGSASGSIVEFGSFRGGSAIFLASVCRSLGLNIEVYGLDTFEGMPPTDKGVDAHNSGDFAGVDLDELRAHVEKCGLGGRLQFVQGVFESTAPELLLRIPPVLLAHIDCDVYDSVAYSWEAVKPFMAEGGYVAFDDAHVSSCLGATEVVEDLVIRRDGLNCEQIWPHFVFRVWRETEPGSGSAESAARREPGPATRVARMEASQSPAPPDDDLRLKTCRSQLDAARREVARLQEQYLELTRKLSEAREEIHELDRRLAESQSSLEELAARFDTLSASVTMGQRSRWLRLGRLFGVGPKFEIPE